ncbi:hypothetical protein SAMN05216383_11261 [Prevotella sp. KH2C16]|nr:hypothetical protein SAMN05216383_11261 [Prevotella sp. KH2C16]
MHSFEGFVHKNRDLCNGFLPRSWSSSSVVRAVSISSMEDRRRDYKRLVILLHTACNSITHGL